MRMNINHVGVKMLLAVFTANLILLRATIRTRQSNGKDRRGQSQAPFLTPTLGDQRTLLRQSAVPDSIVVLKAV
jgi:hypothetical protein